MRNLLLIRVKYKSIETFFIRTARCGKLPSTNKIKVERTLTESDCFNNT